MAAAGSPTAPSIRAPQASPSQSHERTMRPALVGLGQAVAVDAHEPDLQPGVVAPAHQPPEAVVAVLDATAVGERDGGELREQVVLVAGGPGRAVIGHSTAEGVVLVADAALAVDGPVRDHGSVVVAQGGSHAIDDLLDQPARSVVGPRVGAEAHEPAVRVVPGRLTVEVHHPTVVVAGALVQVLAAGAAHLDPLQQWRRGRR